MRSKHALFPYPLMKGIRLTYLLQPALVTHRYGPRFLEHTIQEMKTMKRLPMNRKPACRKNIAMESVRGIAAPNRGLACALVFAGGLLLSQVAGAAPETIRQYLSGRDAEHPVQWEFHASAGRNSGVWTNIAVPACWELQGFGEFRYGFSDSYHEPVRGDYRHVFNVPAEWKGRRVFIVFDGVMTDASVKVNGQEAGPMHQGAFYRFKYDITQLVRFGEENKLEVSVVDQSSNASVNAAERMADYWIFGGIFRPVWLEAEPQQFVDRVAIDARADGAFAMDFFLGGEGRADAVSVTLLDPQGKAVGNPASAPVAAGRVATRILHPELWSAETPALYTAVVQLKQGATVLHEIRRRFGFRTIEVRKGDGFYVNGRKVMMRGVNHHVAWPTLGRASSERIAKLDLDLIREMNMNAVRMSHYPPDEYFLEMCDERGFYVLDELTGWQASYDDEVGGKLVKEMIARDVNHPSIVAWDNGNEGGWNTKLDPLYRELDPQQRPVIHPWAWFEDLETKHYPDYKTLTDMLDSGAVVMPTEFLHGLYDGGAGSGLEDFWQAMRNAKSSAGGFLWVFADEGVQRADLGGKIDVAGNSAPDGIVGPFREKEASFYTIKELWSPAQLPRVLPKNFNGTLSVENRYDFTDLEQCSFRWQLRRFARSTETLAEGTQSGPKVAPGQTGSLNLGLSADWRAKQADALSVAAIDPAGRELWTWVYPLKPQSAYAPQGKPVKPTLSGGELRLKTGDAELRIEQKTGRLLDVAVDGKPFSLRGVGPIENARWQALDSGWFRLDYTVDPRANTNCVGVAFDYPEDKMVKKTWLGNGPYRVWRNRLAGVSLGIWETEYNQTATGWKDWVYPEYGGFFSGVRWLRLTTTEGVLTLVVPDEDKFVRVGTPCFPDENLMKAMKMAFPDGNLAVLGDIPGIGTKLKTPAQTGPQGATPLVDEPYKGTLYLRFESRKP